MNAKIYTQMEIKFWDMVIDVLSESALAQALGAPCPDRAGRKLLADR
jgi:hypothetical protein